MTGFIRNLFGGKAKNPGESDRPVRSKPAPPIEPAGGSFYLDPDDAKTYGNIDYMRSAKTVRRTFAKKRGETGEKESIKKVSAMESVKLQQNGLPEPKLSQASEPTVQQESPRFDRRSVDTSLDMFRQMAKDMKK